MRRSRRAYPNSWPGGIATERRSRRWPIAIATVVGLVAAVAVVWLGQRENPGELVAESVADLGGWRGVSYRGTIADQDGITTGVRLTVAEGGAADGTLTREFGAEAEVAADGRGILISGNHEWWLTDQPAAAEALAGAWVDGPPGDSVGLPFGLPLGPSALAAELSTPGGRPWSEVGRETVDGREGLRLSDGVRQVVVSVAAPRRLLSVSLRRPGPPQVVPRAFTTPLTDPDSGEPLPGDQSEPGPPPEYVENFTIEEPAGSEHRATLRAAEEIRDGNRGRQAPRKLGEFLGDGAPVDAETISLVNRLAERGIDARAALPLQLGKAVLQVLDAITADLTRTDPRAGREIHRATAGIVKAVQNRQFAALHELTTNGNLGNPDTLRNFLQHVQNADTQAHLQAVARLTAAGNKLRIEVPYRSGDVVSSIDWVIDQPAEPGTPPSNAEHKRITGGDDRVRANTEDAAHQLARFGQSDQVTPGSQNHIVLQIPPSATTDVGGSPARR